MPGIRLHHEKLTAPSVVAVECARGYPQPYACPLCGTTHLHKTVHLTLDGHGDVIVSEGVWEDLKDVPGLPFTTSNHVKKPPKVTLTLGETEAVEKVLIHAHRFQGRR